MTTLLLEKESVSLSHYTQIAAILWKYFKKKSGPYILTLNGDLGVGKTHFVQKALASLGLSDLVMSPSFNLINSYRIQHPSFSFHYAHHMDLYRLSSEEEFYIRGLDDYFRQSEQLLLIEWPNKISHFLQSFEYLSIYWHLIQENAILKRNIKIYVYTFNEYL